MTTRAVPPKPRTFQGDLTQLPAILLPLTQRVRWVVWKWEYREGKSRDGKWTKVPYRTRDYNTKAKSNDPKTWGTYQEALATFAAGLCDGIGYMLKDSDLGAIDLDHVRNLETGEVLGWAEQLLAEAANVGCYIEWTVSGAGARIIGIAGGSKLHKKINLNPKTDCAVEFYRGCERYITISGAQISGEYAELPLSAELPGYDALFDALYARYTDAEQRPAPEACEFRGRMLVSVEAIKRENELEADADLNLNTAGAQHSNDYYRDLIENGAPVGQRSEKFQEVVWHLAGLGWSAEQIAEELAKHPNGIGAKYAGRLASEVDRSFNKWQSQRQANVAGYSTGFSVAGAPGTPSSRPWPEIRIRGGELPRVVTEAEDALLLLGREIYQRAGMVVRPVLNRSLKASADRETEGWQLLPVTRAHLVEVLCCAARFLRYDKRAKKSLPDDKKWIQVDCPDRVAEAYLNRQGRWRLPILAGVVNTPFLRVDGSICETQGYDAASHLLFKPENQTFAPLPPNPSKADAAAALTKLRELIKTFPFVSDVDRTVTIAGMLSALDRRSIDHAPLIGFTAPAARTGKSLLVDLINILAAGRAMPVISQGKDEKEFENRLGASLLAGNACISIDNCEIPISGALLCQALTQSEVDIRVLGLSKNVRTAMNASIFATGNNLEIAGDLSDRCLLASLDAKMERPGLRHFDLDVIAEAHASRGELVVAALTILRAWHVARANGERVKIDPFGGFADWSRRVREPLIWLGEPDPCTTMIKVRENDPQRDLLTVVIMQWKQKLGLNTRYTVQDLIGQAIVVPSFYNALLAVAAARTGGAVDTARLGRWLKRVEGKVAAGCSLIQDGSSFGYPKWKLVERK